MKHILATFKLIRDPNSLGLWIPGAGFQSFSGEFGYWIQIRIPWAVFRVSKPRFPFSKQNFSPDEKIYIQTFNRLFSVSCSLMSSAHSKFPCYCLNGPFLPSDSGESSLLSSVILSVRWWIANYNFNKIFRLYWKVYIGTHHKLSSRLINGCVSYKPKTLKKNQTVYNTLMSCGVKFIKRLQIPSLILIRLFIKEDLRQLSTDIQGGKIIAPVNAVLVGYQHSDFLMVSFLSSN